MVNDVEAINKVVEEFSSDIQKATAASAPKRLPSNDTNPRLSASTQSETALKGGWRGSGKSQGTPLWKPRSAATRRR